MTRNPRGKRAGARAQANKRSVRRRSAEREAQNRDEEEQVKREQQIEVEEGEQNRDEEEQAKREQQIEVEGKPFVWLKSNSDDREYKVEMEVALQSDVIQKLIIEKRDSPGFDPSQSFFCVQISSPTLLKVLKYCYHHRDAQIQEAALAHDPQALASHKSKTTEWDSQYISDMDEDTLRDIFLAADYLHHDGLLELASQGIADVLKNKTVEEVRDMFDIRDKFKPGEEEKIRKENAWAFL